MKLTALLMMLLAAPGMDAVAVQCPDALNGNVVIAHQFECTSFYLCDGLPTPSFLLRCPNGMLFGVEGSMGTGVAGGGCVQDAECNPEVEVSAVPAARAARALPPIDTPGDYRNYTMHLPNPANCSQFYRYEGDIEPELFECPKGLGFNSVLESCDSKVTCRSTTCQHVPPPQCPPNNDQLVHLPHQTDCTKFYKCNWGVPVLFDCPDNLYFNPSNSVCDWPRNVPCDRCPPGKHAEGEPDEGEPDVEPETGEGIIDMRSGRGNSGSRAPTSGAGGRQITPSQGGQPARGGVQAAGYASKGSSVGGRQNNAPTSGSGVQPNYGQVDGHQPSSQGYQPSGTAYQSSNQGYQPTATGHQPPRRDYQPTNRQQPNNGYQPTNQGYQPTYPGNQPTNREYQPPNQESPPQNQGRQPPNRQQTNQGYQPSNREYQPINRQQPDQAYQPTGDSWGYAPQGQTQTGQGSRSLEGHGQFGSTNQEPQTVDGYPSYQPDVTFPPRNEYQPTSVPPRSQYQPTSVPPRSQYQPKPTPPVRRYLTAPLDNQDSTGRAGPYQPVITMPPVARYHPGDQSQAGTLAISQSQAGTRPGSQSQGEPRWVDGERPAPAPRVQIKPTSGSGGKPQYYQHDEQEQSYDPQSQGRQPNDPQGRQPYNTQGRQPNDPQGRQPNSNQGRQPNDPEGHQQYDTQGRQQNDPQGRQPYDTQGRQANNPQGRQPYDTQGRQPNDPQSRQPNSNQGRQPNDPQGRQPYDTQGRQPNDPQGRQPYDTQGRQPNDPQGRQQSAYQPATRPSEENASSQPPPSRDFHSIRVYHPESRSTREPARAQAGQPTTPRPREDGVDDRHQPRDPYQSLDQDTDQGPDAGIEQVNYSGGHRDPNGQPYGNAARPQPASQRGNTVQQRLPTQQAARAHQRPGGQYGADADYPTQEDDDKSQPQTRSVDGQLPGLSDLHTLPIGSTAARSSELRAEPPRPVYQHVMRIPTPIEIGRKV